MKNKKGILLKRIPFIFRLIQYLKRYPLNFRSRPFVMFLGQQFVELQLLKVGFGYPS